MNSNKSVSLLSGITGQTGSYLAELLLSKGHEVHGIIRRSSSFNTGRIDHIFDKLHLHYGDLTDSLSIDNIVEKVRPDFVWHLGAQSHVKVSFDVPKYTADVDAVGTLVFLEAVRKHCPKAKFYNATTSELFGDVQDVPQTEKTPFRPRSPYGCAKLYSFAICKNYRESYNMFIVNGILFNHESERRGETFVTSKIVNGLKDFLEFGKPFYLGNLDAKRDWGHAKEYAKGIYLMLQQDEPTDYILATGETHSIKEFINECILFLYNDCDCNKTKKFTWEKDDENRDILMSGDKLVIGIDPVYYRPSEVNLLLGDYSKAKEKLGWEPKVKFKELVKIMMKN